MEDFFSLYLKFVYNNTESPMIYHRWSAITALGAILEKNYQLLHGHSKVSPNLYTMLIGNPGTRKSSAIKLITSIVKEAGYRHIAADKTSKEKFLEDLGSTSNPYEYESFLDFDLDTSVNKEPASVLISADEFNEFAGAGNLEFYALLGSLWDKDGDYHYKTKQGETIIPDPVVSLLGGNTPTGFAAAFPSEIIGQGFFSRLILVYGEPTGNKIAFPIPPDQELRERLVNFIKSIRLNVKGQAVLTKEAKTTLTTIYECFHGLTDPRFESYTNRRFNQLLKLCMIMSAARLDTTIVYDDVIKANTILSFAENYMPKALGEFGKAKHADVMHKIMVALETTIEPLTMKDIWGFVSNDLDNLTNLADIIRNLAEADKIQKVNNGFLPKKKGNTIKDDRFVDYRLLTEEEQNVKY